MYNKTRERLERESTYKSLKYFNIFYNKDSCKAWFKKIDHND